MAKKIEEVVFLNDLDVLVKHTPDYFKQKFEEIGKFNTHIEEHEEVKVGTIVSLGKGILEDDLVGATLYYRPSLCDTIHVKGFGVYDVVVFSTKLLVLDEREKSN